MKRIQCITDASANSWDIEKHRTISLRFVTIHKTIWNGELKSVNDVVRFMIITMFVFGVVGVGFSFFWC